MDTVVGTYDLVIFDDAGCFYVLSAQWSESGGIVMVRGENGIWSCSYFGGGQSGSCIGSDGIFFW